MVIHQTDGSKVRYKTESIDNITFSDYDDTTTNSLSGISVKKIYGDGSTYCAFTSLVKRANVYYLAFREGDSHVAPGDYGVIRILTSKDGENWNLMQTISVDKIDLRDPDLSIKPDGTLMIVCGARMLGDNDIYVTRTYVSFEQEDGRFCSPLSANLPEEVKWEECSWVWRITWHEGVGYGVCYGENNLVIVKTADGANFEVVTPITVNGYPSECQIQFKNDGTAIRLVRRDEGGKSKGYMGQSVFPYSEWKWKELEIYLAGENFLIDHHHMVVVTRMTQNIGQRTVVWFGDFEGNFNFCYTLPYGGFISNQGDTAYAGILNEKEDHWISYYAIYEGEKPCIFMVKLPKNYIVY